MFLQASHFQCMRALEDRNLFLEYGVRCISGEEWKCVDIFLHENYNYHIKYIRVHVITIQTGGACYGRDYTDSVPCG